MESLFLYQTILFLTTQKILWEKEKMPVTDFKNRLF